jgi:hypothetical protein
MVLTLAPFLGQNLEMASNRLAAIQQNPDARLGDYVSDQEYVFETKPVLAGADCLKDLFLGTGLISPEHLLNSRCLKGVGLRLSGSYIANPRGFRLWPLRRRALFPRH